MNHARFARRPAAPAVDIAVSHPRDGRILVSSRYFFADPAADVCRQLVGRLFEVEEVRAVEIRAAGSRAQIEYSNGLAPRHAVVAKIARHLQAGANGHRVRGGAPSGLPSAS